MAGQLSPDDTEDEQFELGRLPKAVGVVVEGGRAVTPSRESTGRLFDAIGGTAEAEVREGVLES